MGRQGEITIIPDLVFPSNVIIPPLHRRWNGGILDSPQCLSVRLSVDKVSGTFWKKNPTICSVYFIPGIHPYGVILLTPINFRVPGIIFDPLVAKYLVENAVSGTFRKKTTGSIHLILGIYPYQSGTKQNLVAKIWSPNLVTICPWLPKLVAIVHSKFHHLVNPGLAVGSLAGWLPIIRHDLSGLYLADWKWLHPIVIAFNTLCPVQFHIQWWCVALHQTHWGSYFEKLIFPCLWKLVFSKSYHSW